MKILPRPASILLTVKRSAASNDLEISWAGFRICCKLRCRFFEKCYYILFYNKNKMDIEKGPLDLQFNTEQSTTTLAPIISDK